MTRSHVTRKRQAGTTLGGICLLVLVLAAPGAEAVEPGTWRVSGTEGWKNTERDSVGITSDGDVMLGLASTRVELEDALTVWDLLPDGTGVLAATGDGGKVYRIDASGAATEVASVVQPEVTCLGRDAAGRVLFGTAPDGTVYRLGPDGAVQIADTPESYVWDITADPRGGAYLGAGDGGRIYRIDPDDGLSVVGDTGTGHVSALLAVDGGLVVTTEGPGRLLRMETDGSVTVLYEAEEGELRAPTPGPDGVLYFLGNHEKSGEGEARVYRRETTGAVERIWTAPSGYGYALEAGADGVLYVATGTANGPGTVIAVHPGPAGRWVEVFHASEPQIASLAVGEGGPRWIGTGGLGRVYRVEGNAAPWGRITSDTFDAGDAARWGAIALDPGPRATGITVRTRSGNTRVPDGGWSDWQEVTLSGNRGGVASPGARFLQWELTLGGNASRLDGVRVAYLAANRAPRVTSLTLTPLGTSFDRGAERGGGAPLTQQLPGGVRVTFETPGGNGMSPANDPDAAWARRYRTVTWAATDPNDDRLLFAVSLRAAGETEWRRLDDELENSPWVWDSSTVPDGWYQLRVEASDADANADGEGLTASRVTEAFPVDNTPPTVEGLTLDGGRVRGTTTDALGAIRAIERSFDGGEWRVVFPEDGIPDMPRERFAIATDDLEPGSHVVLVRAVDEAGNIGTGRLRFTLP